MDQIPSIYYGSIICGYLIHYGSNTIDGIWVPFIDSLKEWSPDCSEVCHINIYDSKD